MNCASAFKGFRKAMLTIEPIIIFGEAVGCLYSVTTAKKRAEEERKEVQKLISMEVSKFYDEKIDALVDKKFEEKTDKYISDKVTMEVARQLQFFITEANRRDGSNTKPNARKSK